MIKRKNILKIAIDSPAAAGAGTIAKALSKHYNLLYLDTGKIYRFIAYLKLKFPQQFNQKFIKKKISSLSSKDLKKKSFTNKRSWYRSLNNFKSEKHKKNCSLSTN